jgi:alpha-tubulin suppressor-like RCC1 family protein
MSFIDQGGEDLQKIYLNDYTLIDQYAATGSLWLWGINRYYGQLGDNTLIHRSSPVQTTAGGTNWRQVAVGTSNTAAIKTDGTLWTWGFNTFGTVGDGTNSNHKSSPVQTISGGTNWRQVSTNADTTAAIKNDGTLWLWGFSSYGGMGTNALNVTVSSPIQTISGGTNWKQVSAGSGYNAAIKTDGTLWLWGRNQYGQLGDNTVVNKSSPVQTVAGGTTWKLVAAMNFHTAAIKTDGTLWSWGRNNYGQLGDNTITHRSSPVQTVAGGTYWRQVAVGSYHTAAIKNDGTLWLWGYNGGGELGDNTVVSESSPIQTIAGGTSWKQVSGGVDLTAAVKTDGSLWLWGTSLFGGLGDNTVVSKSSPVQTIAGGTNWKQVAAGSYYENAAIYFYDANNLYPNS